MALDDFFTLTEMNNGLTVPSRVRELVAVMQKERDGIVKNVGEATRQWSAVGSAIAATENQDCLDLFIQLDGLQFIGKWLKDAQKFSNDSSDSFVEESITHLLQALGKLQVDHDKLVATEIWTTVKDLLIHNSSKVQDKAQVLFESWKRKGDGDASLSDIEKFGALTDDEVGKGADIGRGSGHSESSQRDDSLSIVTSCKERGQELTRDDPVLSTSSDAVHSGQVENTHHSDKNFKPADGDNKPSDHVASPSLSKPATGLPACQSIGATSIESCKPSVSRQDTLDGQTGFQELESASDRKHTPKIEISPEKLGSHEEFNTSDDRPFLPNSDAAYAKKSVIESGSQKISVTGDKSLCDEGSSYIDSGKVDSSGKGSVDDSCSATQYRSSSAFTAEEGSEYRMLCKSSSDEKSWENSKELGTFLSGIGDHGKMKKLDLRVSGDNLANDCNFAKKGTRREPDRAGKKSDVELYGIEDPLEVARQVAIEVQREVVDYREQSCSSSDKLPEGNEQQPDSPNSVSGKQSYASEGATKEVANDPDLSAEASPMQEESTTSTDNLDAEQKNDIQNMDTSQVTEGHQEEAHTEKGLCNFDLNQEVSVEEDDCPRDHFNAPVSIVSASRAAAAPGQPVAPLQFEGNLGWKGSAATSAFRPASPRRMPESDKDLSAGGSGSSSKQRQGCLDIDLNIADSIDGRTGDLSPDKNVPSFFGLPSGESSVETNSRRSELLKLDLNRTSEDGACLSDWRMGQFFPQGNGHHSRSHSSSSSSKQPSLMNINLNDQPSFLNDSSDNSYLSKLSQNFGVSGVMKSDDSAISIMGTRVEVNRKDFVSPTLALPNGQTSGLPFDVNLGRTGSFLGIGSVLPYAHSPVYGYNPIASGPTMPFPSTMYGSGGPIPYMVDSRGAPVIPQIVGSASAFPTGFSQPPFFINVPNPTPNGVGAVGPSRSSFDLNTATMVEGGSRDPASFTQFSNSVQLRLMDDQLRSNSQPTISSVAGGKRKEPDNGWEQYPFKHYTPPRK